MKFEFSSPQSLSDIIPKASGFSNVYVCVLGNFKQLENQEHEGTLGHVNFPFSEIQIKLIKHLQNNFLLKDL